MPILDEDEDGNGIPDPAAERVPDGWFLPTAITSSATKSDVH